MSVVREALGIQNRLHLEVSLEVVAVPIAM
jgi:hypothetical protein